MSQQPTLDEFRQLKKQNQDILKKLEGAKAAAVSHIKELATEFDLAYADVKDIFPGAKMKRRKSGTGPTMKFKTPEGREWAGTGANPPKEFIPFIQKNTLHELSISKTPEAIAAAKKYATNWNEKQKGKTPK